MKRRGKRKSLTRGHNQGKGAEGTHGARRASEGLMQQPPSSPPQRLPLGMLSPPPLLQCGLRAQGRLLSGLPDGKAPKRLGGDSSSWDTAALGTPPPGRLWGGELQQGRAGERENGAPSRPDVGISHLFLALGTGLRPSGSRNGRQGDRGQRVCPPCRVPPRHEDASRSFRSRLLAGRGRL